MTSFLQLEHSHLPTLTPSEVSLASRCSVHGTCYEFTFARADLPYGMEDAFREVLSWTRLTGPLTLLGVASAPDIGSFFVPGWIVIDMAQMRGIAANLIRRFSDVILVEALRIRRPSHPLELDMAEAALRLVTMETVAHEVGHALVHAEGNWTGYTNSEDAADYLAGRLDDARKINRGLGEAFFAEIGCIGASCHHSSSSGRVAAYARGREDQAAWLFPVAVAAAAQGRPARVVGW
jgi:hypothetical protein